MSHLYLRYVSAEDHAKVSQLKDKYRSGDVTLNELLNLVASLNNQTGYREGYSVAVEESLGADA